MPVNITFDAANAAMRVKSAAERALASAKEQIISDCNKFCPKDQGALRQSAETHSTVTSSENGSKLTVTYSTPYAKNLYYGVKMVDPVTHAVGFLNSDGNWRSRAEVKKIPHPDKKEYTYHTDGTQKLWCEKARQEYGDKWEQIIENKLGEELL